jgi:hypothetical protein
VGTGKKARKNQKLGEHKEEDGDEATAATEVEVAEIVVEEIAPAAVTEEAPVAEVVVAEIVVEEIAPAAVTEEATTDPLAEVEVAEIVVEDTKEQGIISCTSMGRTM